MSEEGKSIPVPAPTPAPAPVLPLPLTIEEFQRLALRVGIITAAQDHPNADKLLILTVDIGEAAPRQVVAGIKGSYQASELVGRRVVVVANLKPAKLRGVESQGMVLAASDTTGIALVGLERPIAPGSTVK